MPDRESSEKEVIMGMHGLNLQKRTKSGFSYRMAHSFLRRRLNQGVSWVLDLEKDDPAPVAAAKRAIAASGRVAAPEEVWERGNPSYYRKPRHGGATA